ncbi:MAG: hypothetical protein J6L77_06055 [Coprococcus sp.]|nr:hypothetical protein [Coprococcus sp.]
MKEYLLLFKAISKNNGMDMPENGRKAKSYKIMGRLALCCIMLPCCFIVGFIVYVMTQALIEAGGITEGLELIVQLMSVFGVIFSIMVIFNVMYFSSDLQHLLPLPIKPSSLVAAKFTHAYFAESVMEFMILFCGFIGYFIAAGIKPVSLITAITGVFLIPVLPLVYCGIFCLIIMAFFSKVKLLKNVDFMVGLASFLFVGLFLLSFIQLDNVNINSYIDSMMNGNNIFISIMGKIFFTVPLFLKALGENSIIYFLLFVLINAAAVALLLVLGNALYLKGVFLVSSNGKTGSRGHHKDAVSYERTSALKAYFIKECKILYRTPAYRKYCVVVNMIWPVLVAAMFILPSTKDFMAAFRRTFINRHVLSDVIVLMMVIAISFFATAMNSIASTSFTREGAHFTFIKHVPLPYEKQIQVKSLVSILYSGITVMISIVMLCVLMGCSPLQYLYFLIIGILSVVVCTYIGIMLDGAHPRLNWEDEYGALRGNLNAFFNMAIAILIAMVLCAVGWLLFRYTRFSSGLIYAIYLAVMIFACYRMRRTSVKHTIISIKRDLYS